MINKNSLLDAYIALISSASVHLGMLIAVCAVIQYPSQLPETSEFYNLCTNIFEASAVSHGLAVALFIPTRFERFESSFFGQLLSICVVFAIIYTNLLALDLFLDLQAFHIMHENILSFSSPISGKFSLKWLTQAPF